MAELRWLHPLGAAAALALAGDPRIAAAQAPAAPPAPAPSRLPQLLGAQIDVIAQGLRRFRSPYEGPNSLTAAGDRQLSHTYGLYLGQRVTRRLQAYLDVEMARGAGVGRTVGLAGITNGDVIRQGSADLGQGPYVARAFVRYLVPLSSGTVDTMAQGPDQLAGISPAHRVELQVGRFAVSDLFDVNRYANSTRLQFMNWGLFQNTAWDFAADTRGYSKGVSVAWVNPGWTLRAGSFAMPRQANGNVFDTDLRQARGDNVELTLSPPAVAPLRAPVIRVLAYLNHARMGSYAAALAAAAISGGRPDVVADDRPARTKYGWGVNVEQPLADSGDTGLFARVGWNDGKNESFAFTEADRHASVGAQVAGVRWHRLSDRIGVALVRHGLSPLHRQYLAAGGSGFLLGDGALAYGGETIGEAYYRLQLGGLVELTPDVQRIVNPGFNRDRGPATVTSLRMNLRY